MSKQSFKTPKGKFRWAFITGEGRKNLNGEMEYTINVEMPEDEAKPLTDAIDALWEENKPKGAKAPKSLGYKLLDDGETVSFNLKTKTTYPSGDKKFIRIYDAKARPVNLDVNTRVGNESEGRASGVMAVYDAGVAARGVTLYLDAVQITKLIKFEPDSSFDAEDGDFSAEDEGEFAVPF
jgi:hypothetical protein